MLYGFRWIVLLSFYFCSLFSLFVTSLYPSKTVLSIIYLTFFLILLIFSFLFPGKFCFICLFKPFYLNCLIIRFGLQPAGSASSLALTENILPPCRLPLQRSRTPRQAKAEYRTGSTYFHSPPRPC